MVSFWHNISKTFPIAKSQLASIISMVLQNLINSQSFYSNSITKNFERTSAESSFLEKQTYFRKFRKEQQSLQSGSKYTPSKWKVVKRMWTTQDISLLHLAYKIVSKLLNRPSAVLKLVNIKVASERTDHT